MSHFRTLVAVIVAASLAACSDAGTDPVVSDVAELGDATRGFEIFKSECSSCHGSGDGFDLAFFDFPDSTIIRRALGHVTHPEALDIVAHIDRMNVTGSTREASVFQPDGRVLFSDQAFAFELLGQDRWPEEMTTEDLLAIDPRDVPIAMSLPRWSVELENVDWMPDRPLDADIRDFYDAGTLLDAYQTVPSDQNLLHSVQRMRGALLHHGNPTAPCLHHDPDRPVEYERCFQNQRWVASFGALHMLRRGDDYLHELVHDAFWDVGFTARMSVLHGGDVIENGEENWATWTWTGWMFDPGRHASVYSAGGVARMGLDRHATFLILRSQVARPAGTHHPYNDAFNASRFAPDHWVGSATHFALVHLEERLLAGDTIERVPMNHTMQDFRDRVTWAARHGSARAPEWADRLNGVAERVLRLMPTD